MANRAAIVFDPELTNPATLVEAVRGAGYDAALPRAAGNPNIAHPPEENTYLRAWVTLCAGAAAMLLSMPLDSSMGPLDSILMGLAPVLYQLPPASLRWTLLVLTAPSPHGPAAESTKTPPALSGMARRI